MSRPPTPAQGSEPRSEERRDRDEQNCGTREISLGGRTVDLVGDQDRRAEDRAARLRETLQARSAAAALERARDPVPEGSTTSATSRPRAKMPAAHQNATV